MTENFCGDHQVPFFKKGRMKGFAHPIVDAEGKDTGQWCNMPEGETPTEVQRTQPPTKVEKVYKEAKIPKSSAMSSEDWERKDAKTRKSIERQTALNNAVELVKLLKPSEHLTKITIDTAKRFEKYIETGE